MDTRVLIYMILSYVIGSFPTSYIVGKIFKKVDIRELGSGNVGATNTFRVLGVAYGVPVLIIDILKGALPTYFFGLRNYPNQMLVFLAIGISAILGHVFSIFLKFKGGKGVATSLGVFLVILPKCTISALSLFLIIFFTTGYVSLGSIIAALGLPVIFHYMYFSRTDNNMLLGISVVSFMILLAHRGNISRLLSGKERRLLWKKRGKSVGK